MPPANAETVQEIIDAINRGDVDAVLARVDADFEWRPLEDSPAAGTYRGHDQVRHYLEDWLDHFDRLRLEVENLSEEGGQVVAAVRGHGRGKLSGVELHSSFCQVWTLRDGTPVRMEEHATR